MASKNPKSRNSVEKGRANSGKGFMRVSTNDEVKISDSSVVGRE